MGRTARPGRDARRKAAALPEPATLLLAALGGAGNIMQPTANAAGTTSAYAGDGTDVWASKLDLDADGVKDAGEAR
mgnify:CR=1 FL=1